MEKVNKNQLPDSVQGVEIKESIAPEVTAATIAPVIGLVKIRVLLPLAGRFLLPNNPGAEIEINENQAIEIVESGYGEYIEDNA